MESQAFFQAKNVLLNCAPGVLLPRLAVHGTPAAAPVVELFHHVVVVPDSAHITSSGDLSSHLMTLKSP